MAPGGLIVQEAVRAMAMAVRAIEPPPMSCIPATRDKLEGIKQRSAGSWLVPGWFVARLPRSPLEGITNNGGIHEPPGLSPSPIVHSFWQTSGLLLQGGGDEVCQKWNEEPL